MKVVTDIPILLVSAYDWSDLEDLAKEWACDENRSGFANHYLLDADSLTEQELEAMFSVTAESLPAISTRLMMEFFNECLQDGKYGYVVHKRKVKESSNTAYSFRDYSTMAYLVFNEESWEANDLVRKALRSKKYADHW